MQTPTEPSAEVDLHRLELRFADARLSDAQAVDRLARSIEQSGQLVACIAVPEDGGARLILVDGYRRVQALRRLGRDTAYVQSWSAELAQALLTLLARTQSRRFTALEEGLLLRELVQGQGLSEREVARRSGHDVSWVSRRLELVCGLSEPLFEAVRKGEVSTWAATRVLAPLARANSAHAVRLLEALAVSPLSSRDLQRWFAHYLTTPRAGREQLVSHPRLFIQTLRARQEQRTDAAVREGPEGQCAAQARQLLALIKRLRGDLPTLGAPPLPVPMLSLLTRLPAACDGLRDDIERILAHDADPDSRCGQNPARPRPEPARHQPDPQAVA
jgi:ParB-like chromosome segregation protein Spo0J